MQRFFFGISPGNQLIIFYQLTNFEAASCKSFRDIFFKLVFNGQFCKGQ